jgi:hypothetical protein
MLVAWDTAQATKRDDAARATAIHKARWEKAARGEKPRNGGVLETLQTQTSVQTGVG